MSSRSFQSRSFVAAKPVIDAGSIRHFVLEASERYASARKRILRVRIDNVERHGRRRRIIHLDQHPMIIELMALDRAAQPFGTSLRQVPAQAGSGRDEVVEG
jgi:hypothetical protein